MTIESLKTQLRDFAQDRDWEQFHTPKNLVMALSGEAGELTALFQWLKDDQVDDWLDDSANRTAVEQEVADIFGYLLRLVDVLGIDLEAALLDKMTINGQKYPIALAKGNALKYTAFAADDTADA